MIFDRANCAARDHFSKDGKWYLYATGEPCPWCNRDKKAA